ncbi:MAG: LD-carboxypeptidase [Oscillospiraceae bacterium]|nr:LD-carboxypeptidase [Oscillospiraceae bacterium]
MKFPEFLKKGEAIGFVAPSFGCNIEPYRSSFGHAIERFSQLGHPALCGPNVYAGDGVGISTAPEKCGREFTDMYLSDACRAVLSCGGGEMMCEILRFVDFDTVAAARPKWFMGYSDNTNLSFLLPTLCDTAAIYGPCAPAFGMEPWHSSIEDAYRLLRGEKLSSEGYPLYEIQSRKDEEHPLEPYHCTEARRITACDPKTAVPTQRSIAFSGRLIGGCLDILATLCGTRFDKVCSFTERYREDGLIWFLEACDLSVFGIRRAVWQLKNAGWFENASGFLIGRPLAGREDQLGLDHIRAVTDILSEYHVPILLDTDIGHLPPMMPLICGSMADVSYDPVSDDFRLEMHLR